MPEITPEVIALREAVKAFEAAEARTGRGEPRYDDANCRAALQLYQTATGQDNSTVAGREVKEKLAELRDTRAAAQLAYDIEHAMDHAFGARLYGGLNQPGYVQLVQARGDAGNAYQEVLDSLGMGGPGSYATLSQLSTAHCRICQIRESERMRSV